MSPALPAGPQPLAGVKVVELTHMVMGPATGAILAELGAEVVRIEPIGGDSTRHLQGSGAGQGFAHPLRVASKEGEISAGTNGCAHLPSLSEAERR